MKARKQTPPELDQIVDTVLAYNPTKKRVAHASPGSRLVARAVRVAEVRAEHLLTDLLEVQGWDCRRPPAGELLRQQEYKDHPHLLDAFRGKSKSGGGGAALPEAVLVDRESLEPLAVIEAKAATADLPVAEREATQDYGNALVEAGFRPLAIALAGASEDEFKLRVHKWMGTSWKHVTYDGNPISWIPNRADAERLRSRGRARELRPSVPPPEVLAKRADEINRLLREARIKDEYRPACIGAMMLALWQSKGNLRKDTAYILDDINSACEQAFWRAKKGELGRALRLSERNAALARKALRIITILERLNVAVLTAEHDYLGQLYEAFFRYTGGNTIGQYFTPRHVTEFASELVEVGMSDTVLDPACGTGGFLIAAIHRVQREHKLSRKEATEIVGKQLVGFETEPITAALCVANMILRGDGKTGIHQADCFTSKHYPGNADVVLTNPPFQHKGTDTPTERFIDRALGGLARRGRLAMIVPQSLLVKKDKRGWRANLLERHTLDGVILLPDELFQPHASTNTAIILVTKGVPHAAQKHVFFARVENDGLRLSKGVRRPRDGEQLTQTLKAYLGRSAVPGYCGWAPLNAEAGWAPGAYIPARTLSRDEIIAGVGELLRIRTAFVALHAPHLSAIHDSAAPYVEPGERSGETIGGCFEIRYGQKVLHNKGWLKPGTSLIISATGLDNGCYGFFEYDGLITPPFATVPSTGSIGEARVQEWPCGVADDCLLLFPKRGVSRELLYVAAAVVRRERWRFSYGRKITPERIAGFPLPMDDGLVERVRVLERKAQRIERFALADARETLIDDYDVKVARERAREAKQPGRLVVIEDRVDE